MAKATTLAELEKCMSLRKEDGGEAYSELMSNLWLLLPNMKLTDEDREKFEIERFILLYNINLNDLKKAKEIFDLIIDTEKLSIEESVSKILEEIKKINN